MDLFFSLPSYSIYTYTNLLKMYSYISLCMAVFTPESANHNLVLEYKLFFKH